MKGTAVIIASLIALATRAQTTAPVISTDNPLRVATKPFMNPAAGHLVMEGDSSAWQHLFDRMDRLLLEGRGQVNVVHVGGSHVQADMWSMEMRHRFQTVAPGVRAGRGFIFPFNMAKSNNPWWYNPEYTGSWTGLRNVVRTDSSTLGAAGISVTTRDTLSTIKVSFRGDAYPGYAFNSARVLHHMDSSYAVTAWDIDPTVRIARRVDTLGGYTEFTYDRYMDTLRLRIERTDSTQRKFTLGGIVLGSDDPGFFLHALGVNGASTSSWLRCQRFTEELALLKPDLVIFSVGINDAHDANFSAKRYEDNYRELIRRVRQANPKAAILLTTNTDSYMKRRYVNKNGGAVRDAMLRLSMTEGVAVWDALGVMGGEGSMRAWEKAGLAKRDRVHLTREGYTVLGDLLFAAVMEAYGQHLKLAAR